MAIIRVIPGQDQSAEIVSLYRGSGNAIKKVEYAQPNTPADWKKRGGLAGKLFGQPAEFAVESVE